MDTTTAATPSSSTPSDSSNSIFLKFDSYPWTQDRDFIQGLHATLGSSLSSSSDPFTRRKLLDTILQTRVWWYQSRFPSDPAVDLNSYLAFSRANPRTNPDQEILKKTEWIYQQLKAKMAPAPKSGTQEEDDEDDIMTGTTKNIPTWQLDAPKLDLSKKADDHEVRTGSGSGSSDGGDGGKAGGAGGGAPSYPDKFQAIIEAVTTGKTIEGVREIPDTVVRQEGITPVGMRVAPQKPWQRHLPPKGAAVEGSQFGNVLDTQFPPIA